MSIKLQPDTEKYLLASIKRFVAEYLDADIGDLKAPPVPRALRPGASIYKAIADGQKYMQDKAADLGGNRYEAEFDYWKK